MAPDLTAKKLIARDSEDLNVFSALMQDAALTPKDMGYDAAARRFALTANRYIAEKGGFFKKPKGYRQRVGLHFNHVTKVQQKGIDDRVPALSLLAVRMEEADEAATITLEFAGGATIQIMAECVDAVLTDMGEPWEAIARPVHP